MKFSWVFSVLVMSSQVALADFSTARVAVVQNTFQTPTHFEHVFGVGERYQKEVILEQGTTLADIVGEEEGIEIDIEVTPAELSPWEKYCSNKDLTKAEYLVIDEGNMPEELVGKCVKKGKSPIKKGVYGSVNEIQPTAPTE